MVEKLIKEHIDRAGIVTRADLIQQTGAAADLLWEPMTRLIEAKEILYCRMDHGRETFLSRHLFLCLRAVQMEPTLSENAQNLYDWLSDNETACTKELQKYAEKWVNGAFFATLHELLKRPCVVPIKVCGKKKVLSIQDSPDIDALFELMWVTDDYWGRGVTRSARYNDLEYDILEVRRLLATHFSTREIEKILYHME